MAETNKYIILNNPLLYADSNEEIQGVVNNIYTQIKNISYAPGTIELLEDYGINCGDIIKCDGKTFYVMKKEISNSGVVLTCVGSQERTESSNLNREIQALRGKTNTLTRDLEASVSTLTDTTAGLQSQITQTASQIQAQVSSVDGRVNTITQTLDGVVFQDSSTGQTVIDGSHIKAGTLTLTGQVDWSDLSSSCRSTISSMSSGYSDYDVRSYLNRAYGITQTTMDGTTIAAPNIIGGTIYGAEMYAGAGDSSYVGMTSEGFQLYTTSNGRPLARLGFAHLPAPDRGDDDEDEEETYYNYPYLTLGYGVNEGGSQTGMIKKFADGIWIGDNADLNSTDISQGTGFFIDFTYKKIYKVIKGVMTQL